MKNATSLLILCWILLPTLSWTQNQNCPHFKRLMDKADRCWKDGDFEQAFNQLAAAREHCPDKSAEVDKKSLAFTKEITKKYNEAELLRLRAGQKTLEAEAKTKEVEQQQQRVDSTARVAQMLARRSYANDLASKSKLALQEGDRTTAFRLAEFAYHYVDSTNIRLTAAMVDAIYYNDNNVEKPLPWASNFEGHSREINDVAVSNDGKLLATASVDYTARIWDIKTRQEIKSIMHTNPVSKVKFSPDNKEIITAGHQTVSIWDIESGKLKTTFIQKNYFINDLAISPDGKKIAISIGGDSLNILIFHRGEQPKIDTIKGYRNAVYCLAFSPTGNELAAGYDNGLVIIWNLTNGQRTDLNSHKYRVLSMDYSRDGKMLVSGSFDKTAQIWDLEKRQIVKTLSGHTNFVQAVMFSPNGQFVATGSDDKTAKIWDVNTGIETMELNGHTKQITALAYSDSAHLVTVSFDQLAKIWHIAEEKEAIIWDDIEYAVVAKDGQTIATTSFDNIVRIRDVRTGKTLKEIPHQLDKISSIDYAPNGQYLVIGADSSVVIFDIPQGKIIHKYFVESGSVQKAIFSSNSKYVAAIYEYNKVKVWELAKNDTILSLRLNTFGEVDIFFSNDCMKLGIKTGTDTYLYLLDGTIWKTQHYQLGIYSVSISSNDRFLSTGHYGNCKIWDLYAGKYILTLDNGFSPFTHTAFFYNDRYLVSGSNNTVKLWNLSTGKAELSLNTNYYAVSYLNVTPDGRRIIAKLSDNTLMIWTLNPDTWLQNSKVGSNLAGLSLDQLENYDLENLLDQMPGSEDKLLATGKAKQIIVFAERYYKNHTTGHFYRLHDF
jgi:WD40 repeat protein